MQQATQALDSFVHLRHISRMNSTHRALHVRLYTTTCTACPHHALINFALLLFL